MSQIPGKWLGNTPHGRRSNLVTPLPVGNGAFPSLPHSAAYPVRGTSWQEPMRSASHRWEITGGTTRKRPGHCRSLQIFYTLQNTACQLRRLSYVAIHVTQKRTNIIPCPWHIPVEIQEFKCELPLFLNTLILYQMLHPLHFCIFCSLPEHPGIMYFIGRNGSLIIAVMWVETLIALLFVIARIYTRARLVRNIFWEDHLISISMVGVSLTVDSVLYRANQRLEGALLWVHYFMYCGHLKRYGQPCG